MHISQHADQRMNQRGISRRLVITTYNVRVPLIRRRYHHAGGFRHV